MRRNGTVDRSRRSLLLRLGLAATTVYIAPVLTHLSGARASSPSFSSSRPRRRVQRLEILVSAPLASDIDRIAAQGFTLLSRSRISLTDSELARFRVPPGLTVARARARVLQIAPAAVFDLNHVYRPGEFACGADTCAAFGMIGWKAAAHACPAGTTIGMIDTGVDLRHEALRDVAVEHLVAIADGRRPASTSHGTAVAILLAGRGDTRTPGLLDGVRLIAAQAFHRDARGQDAADAFDVARALDLLAERRVGVINMSFAGPENAVLGAVVGAARARDIVLVAAAGNDGPRGAPRYPAAYEGVIAVTAVDASSRVYRQANSGAYIDFAAPGVRLWTASPGREGRFRSGTSYAAPFVSAAYAVARARDAKKRVEELTADLAKGAIDLGRPGRDATFGWGLVQSSGECTERASGILRPVASPFRG